MPRIAGVNIPDQKKIGISLTYLYGVGRTTADAILEQAKIDPQKRAHQLTADEVARLREIVEKNYKVEGDLRRQIQANIKRLRDTGTYRGLRHIRHLPVRGQRTKTNSRTVRGNVRKTVGSGRKKAAEKT
jgi:small subunit ribosomal protein S13